MSKWLVIAGDAVIPIEEADFNEQARRKAADLFRSKHGIKLPIDYMLPEFHAYRVPEPKSDAMKEEVLVLFYKGMESTYRKDTRGRRLLVGD